MGNEKEVQGRDYQAVLNRSDYGPDNMENITKRIRSVLNSVPRTDLINYRPHLSNFDEIGDKLGRLTELIVK